MRIVAFILSFILAVAQSTEDPPGHLQPLGSHQPPEESITVVDVVPSPREFFENYVKPGKPVIFRGAAKAMPPYTQWTDDYLSKKFGGIRMDVEEGKKENRSLATFNFKLQDFIRRYKKEDVYMVESLPKQMQEEYMLLKSLHCGGFTDVIQDAVMWFSSGGTKSVLHFDAVENVNCLFSGSKKFVMIDKKYKPQAHIDRLDGSFSSVDVEKVDMYKFPGLQNIPWYNVSMEEGDCMYIPFMWIHHVHSFGSRNLAINIWWAHFTFFNYSDCKDSKYKDTDNIPLSDFTIKPMETTRQQLLEHLGRKPVTKDEWIMKLKELAERYGADQMPDERAIENFIELDKNKDGTVSADEILAVDHADIDRLLSPSNVEEQEGEGEQGDEIGAQNEENIRNEAKEEL